MSSWVYGGVCLVLPALWSVLVQRLVQRVERRRRAREVLSEARADYSI